MSGRFVWPAELTTTGREGRWAPFQLDQSVATHIVRFHPKPVSCKTVFLQLLIQNPLLFRWTEGKAFSPPLTLLSCQSAKGARLCHCFLFIVISSMPKLIVCQCCSQNWFQVLVRHSFRSSRLAELSVVKGEVRKTFSMLTLPLQSAQHRMCVNMEYRVKISQLVVKDMFWPLPWTWTESLEWSAGGGARQIGGFQLGRGEIDTLNMDGFGCGLVGWVWWVCVGDGWVVSESVDSGCHKLSENIWFVWSKTSYSGDKWRCHRCGTPNNGKIGLLSLWSVKRWVVQYWTRQCQQCSFEQH